MKVIKEDLNNNYYIRWFYDRFTKSWVIQVFDPDGNEEESEYLGNRDDLKYEVEYFKKKYNTSDARKYKSGE